MLADASASQAARERLETSEGKVHCRKEPNPLWAECISASLELSLSGFRLHVGK